MTEANSWSDADAGAGASGVAAPGQGSRGSGVQARGPGPPPTPELSIQAGLLSWIMWAPTVLCHMAAIPQIWYLLVSAQAAAMRSCCCHGRHLIAARSMIAAVCVCWVVRLYLIMVARQGTW